MTRDPNAIRERAQAAFAELFDIVYRLRAPHGCPWDREQTPATLKPFIIEEAYEVLDAIDAGQPAALCEELGDLMLQVMLQSEIASEAGAFDVADVSRGISKKLVSRHPHVFGDVEAKTAEKVLSNWEHIKKKEKVGQGLFDGLPTALPALQRAARMGDKASRVGFDWEHVQDVRAKVEEELNELDEAVASGDQDAIRHELGDVLFAVAQWARHLKLAPEESLRESCGRFRERFYKMDRAIHGQGMGMDQLTIDELEAEWQKAKR